MHLAYFYHLMLSDNKDKVKMFTELVQVFNEAWLLLKDRLPNHGKCSDI